MSNRDSVQSKRLRGVAVPVWFLLAAAAGQGASIGPDAFGYVANDATVYSFVDIASSGVGVLAGADDDQAVINIGFAFQFYGQTYTSVCASTNGLISFGGCNPAFANQDLTASSPPGNLPTVAPFWSDLSFAEAGSGAIHYQTLGTAPNRRFVVQWTNAYPINAPEGITFQVIFFESGNRILFQYKDVNAGAGSPVSLGGRATVGIRDAGGQANGRRLQWSYNVPVLKNGMALEFLLLGSTPVELGLAGPQHWVILSLGQPTTVALSGSVIVTGSVAHVGIAAKSDMTISGRARVDGKLWLHSAGKLAQTGGQIAGGVLKDGTVDAKLNQAVADALKASAAAAALPRTLAATAINISTPAANQTITGGPGRNVLNLTELIITKGTLTLCAPPAGSFVINISKKFEVSGESRIETACGLMPLSILYNATGTGDVSLSGGSAGAVPKVQVSGIVLAPNRAVYVAPSQLIGEVIAGGPKITLEGQGQITNPF